MRFVILSDRRQAAGRSRFVILSDRSQAAGRSRFVILSDGRQAVGTSRFVILSEERSDESKDPYGHEKPRFSNVEIRLYRDLCSAHDDDRLKV
jgi:hypothetical protein